MNRGYQWCRVVIVLSVFMISASGCDSFNRKFVRQKKKDTNAEFIPVLDPIEYPATIHSPSQEYKQHYGLWKAWHRELLQEVDVGDNDKRLMYLLGECVSHLTEMKMRLQEDKQEGANRALKNLDRVSQELSKPAMMRQTNTLKIMLERNGDEVINNLSPTVMVDNFIKPIVE